MTRKLDRVRKPVTAPVLKERSPAEGAGERQPCLPVALTRAGRINGQRRVRRWLRGHSTAMGTGTSIFLIAAGAILKFAVTDSISGIKLATVGVILMVVGIIGLVVSLLVLLRADRGAVLTRERVVERDPHL